MNSFTKKSSTPKPPRFNVPTLHPITEAFESGGVRYFQFNDIMTLCHARAFRAYEVYEEVQMKCTREMLKLHTAAIDNLLRGDKIDIFKINELNSALKERLEFVISGDTIWKLAAVVYFDENENPYDYDYKYGIEKIKKWKAEQDVAAFFFNSPIQTLIPSLTLSEEDLRTYMKVGEAITKEQLQQIYQYTFKGKVNNDLYKISELLNTASH